MTGSVLDPCHESESSPDFSYSTGTQTLDEDLGWTQTRLEERNVGVMIASDFLPSSQIGA